MTVMETGSTTSLSLPHALLKNCWRHSVTILLNVIIGNATHLEDVTQIAFFNERVKTAGYYT